MGCYWFEDWAQKRTGWGTKRGGAVGVFCCCWGFGECLDGFDYGVFGGDEYIKLSGRRLCWVLNGDSRCEES